MRLVWVREVRLVWLVWVMEVRLLWVRESSWGGRRLGWDAGCSAWLVCEWITEDRTGISTLW